MPSQCLDGEAMCPIDRRKPCAYNHAVSGEWRSLVARLLWEQEVAGSNPVSPKRNGDLQVSDTSAYISLYRRFRPQRFSEVVGQEEIVRTLRNAVIADEVAHAYLFAGERGIGKTSIARILARAVNCLNPQGGEPCNNCTNCKTILTSRSLDILEIDGASNRGIDHIRRLREEVNFAPTDLKTKVYIIDEVHMLTNEAFNALLKTLEEPPPHVVFIFATTQPHKVPRTIVSRCQAFDFRKIQSEKIAARLAEIALAEKITISKDALHLLARKANGGMRDAIVMLEQAVSFKSGEITTEALLEMLGLVGHEVGELTLKAVETGDRKTVLKTIDSLVERGKDLEVFLDDLVGILRDRLVHGGDTEKRDIRLCRGLLDIKQQLYRSLDRQILLEIGLLTLMDELGSHPQPPLPEKAPKSTDKEPDQKTGTPLLEGTGLPQAAPEAVSHRKEPATPDSGAKVTAPTEESHSETSATPEAESPAATEEANFTGHWKKMIEEIERERIAIAAFLFGGTARLSGNKVTIAFHPEHNFHKESLEKPQNLQYLAGMVHRHLGDQFNVDIEFDDGVVRKPASQKKLLEKAQLVCQTFNGKIVKEG